MINLIKTEDLTYVSSINGTWLDKFPDFWTYLQDDNVKFGGIVQQTSALSSSSAKTVKLKRDLIWDMNGFKTTKITFNVTAPNTVIFKNVSTAPTITFQSGTYAKFTGSRKIIVTKNFKMVDGSPVYTGREIF